jgi:hypothetical protein
MVVVMMIMGHECKGTAVAGGIIGTGREKERVLGASEIRAYIYR